MKMEPLIPDPNGRWGYIRKGTPRQWNPSPIAKHKEFAQKISSANLMAKPLLCLKWLLGWWMTFMPLYPFLFLLDTSDPVSKALIFTVVLLPLAVLFAPFLIIGGLGWYIFTSLPMLIGKGATLILLGGYLISICFWGYTILRIYLPYVKLCLCDIRGPYKADRL